MPISINARQALTSGAACFDSKLTDRIEQGASMDMQEHFYVDDPATGHPDIRTRLADVDYFFVGNGRILAAVQVCRSGEGTPVGLLVMDPMTFGPKRAAITCDRETGLTDTMLAVRVGTSVHTPRPGATDASWDGIDGVPAVRVSWMTDSLRIEEMFYCPDRSSARLHRRVDITSADGRDARIVLLAHQASDLEEHPLEVSCNSTARALLAYEVVSTGDGYGVATQWKRSTAPTRKAVHHWDGLATYRSGDRELDHMFTAARNQLPVAVDAAGRMDGSIWQYNLEWVRDQAHVAEALVRLGDQQLARTMLARLLDEFVSPRGDTVDSGRLRPIAEIELDQNGELLTALRTYVDWTGDIELVASRWSTIRHLAAFPLRSEFLHDPSGLLHNRREYWERHEGHGIEDGFELIHQFFVSLGLSDAAYLAGLTGNRPDRREWIRTAAALRRAMLDDAQHRLVENGHFIKRRGIDGAWQQTINAPPHCPLPDGIPLKDPRPHYLDPDTSTVLPVAYGYIDPKGKLAGKTLAYVDQLWNQEWDGGGYGRYNASSEADSAGPWPFASLFVARAYVEAGIDEKVWRILRWLARKPGGIAGTWFEFDGPRITPPYPQVGVTPWTWAELITLCLHHLVGVRPDSEGITIRPRLLEGLDHVDASFRVRGHRVELEVRRALTDSGRGGRIGPDRLEWRDGGVRLAVPESDIAMEVSC
jgi:hypothetical protein